MPKLHLFNPSHEMALAANTAQYTPTKTVAKMERDMCRLPLMWAAPDDFVLTPDGIINTKGDIVQLSADMIPEPWGWNKAVKRRFLQLGVAEELMPTDAELELWRTFASRRWAAEYAEHLYSGQANTGFLVENHMHFCHTNEDLASWIDGNKGHEYILKSEYSSSGRGNTIGRMRPAPVLADRFYEKTLDFALEFEIKETEVCYLGLSVFQASRQGKYESNYRLPQAKLQQILISHIDAEGVAGNGSAGICGDYSVGICGDDSAGICGDDSAGISCDDVSIGGALRLTRLISMHRALLSTHLLGRYRGIVGIDMLVTDKHLIHPCIEINLRMNMGVVAMMANRNIC